MKKYTLAKKEFLLGSVVMLKKLHFHKSKKKKEMFESHITKDACHDNDVSLLHATSCGFLESDGIN